MKKIYLILTTALLAASCEFLDEKSYTKVDGDVYYNNASQNETVLLGVYKELNAQPVYGQNLTMLFELPTDECKINGNTLVGSRQQASNAYNSSDSYIQNTWGSLYEGIYRANSFIENVGKRMENIPEEDIEETKVQLAEAKCLRALFYFDLVRWFGNVPLMKTTAQSSQHPSTFTQADPVEVYQFIEADLTEAIDVLPYATDDDIRSSNDFRFSKGGAQGLLAKVYATWAGYPLLDTSKWEKAKEVAGALVDSGKHSLLPNYDQLWKNSGASVWDPSESLIELSFYAPKATVGMNGYVGKFNGVVSELDAIRSRYAISLVSVMPVFIQEWLNHSGDLRCDISYADYKYTAKDGKTPVMTATIDKVSTPISFKMAADENEYGWTVNWRRYFCYNLYPKKWDTELYVPDENVMVDNNLSNVNWYVLRYADILLLYAEILNEVNHGPNFEAYNAINAVRRRGYGLPVNEASNVSDLESGLSYEEFQKAVRKERSYELAFEGQRRQDLIRWGIYYETIWDTYEKLGDWNEIAQAYLPAIEYTKKGKNELLPIPQREIDLCGFKQNPNW